MGRQSDIIQAKIETEQTNAWKCKTCTSPTLEGSEYCFSCKSYWEDVAAGLFDKDWDGEWLLEKLARGDET